MQDTDGTSNLQYESSELTYEIAQKEYDHVFDSSLKLDNKINIALTFCGVIFLSMVNLLDFNKVSFPIELKWYFLISCIYCVGVIATMAIFIVSIISLISLVNPTSYDRISGKNIIDKKLYRRKREIAATYMMVRYIEATARNFQVNQARALKYKNAMKSIAIVVILIIILYFIKFNFL